MIHIACDAGAIAPLEDLHDFQNEMKTLSTMNYLKLRKEIEETGFSFAVHVWENDGKLWILDGHQRVECLRRMAAESAAEGTMVPIVRVEAKDYREAKRKVMAAASQFGEFQIDGLMKTLGDAQLEPAEASTMFDFPLIDLLNVQKLEVVFPKKEEEKHEEPKADEDAAPEPKKNPITKLGQIYKLGNHRLMCGDSTSIPDLERLLGGEKAELVFTDPPYRMATSGGGEDPVGRAQKKLSDAIQHLCDFDPRAFLKALPTVFPEKIMNAFVFCNKDLVPDYLNWAIKEGYAFNILFWKKPNAIPLGGSHRPDVEYLLFFRKNAHWNNGVEGANYSRCLEHGRENSTPHPTMKPVALIENQILISSNRDANVLDMFGGSGSTMIACEKTGRRGFLMELDPSYCDVIVERWENYTGKKAELL